MLGTLPTGLPALPLLPGSITGDAYAFVSTAVASRLRVVDGDAVRIGIEKISAVPRSSLLGRRSADDTTQSLTVKVFVLPADSAANDFALIPSPQTPLNVYVPLGLLQEKLGIPGKCNAILSSTSDVAAANKAFAKALDLPDWGIRVVVPPKRDAYVSVESESLVLDGPTVAAVERAATKLGLRAERTFVYLANEIAIGDKAIPYSVVCATNVAAPAPLGPFLPPGVSSLADDEIVLADWTESPLKGAKPGEMVTLTYLKPELEGGEEKATAHSS